MAQSYCRQHNLQKPGQVRKVTPKCTLLSAMKERHKLWTCMGLKCQGVRKRRTSRAEREWERAKGVRKRRGKKDSGFVWGHFFSGRKQTLPRYSFKHFFQPCWCYKINMIWTCILCYSVVHKGCCGNWENSKLLDAKIYWASQSRIIINSDGNVTKACLKSERKRT